MRNAGRGGMLAGIPFDSDPAASNIAADAATQARTSSVPIPKRAVPPRSC
jgi:hypothetical protein